MVATLLHCIESLKDIEGIGTSTIWGVRETVSRHASPTFTLTLCPFFDGRLYIPIYTMLPRQEY